MFCWNRSTAPRRPAKRWRRHDLRHTLVLQLLPYLEQLMHGDEPDHATRSTGNKGARLVGD